MLATWQQAPSISSLFASGEVGAWYDANDLTTIFQDAAGTVAGAIESPVGLIRDKSGRGNHASQSTSANRPTLTARYNLLLATATLSTQSVTTVATNYVLYFTGTGSVTLSGTSSGTYTAGSNTITCTAGTLTLTVTGSVLTADLRPADQANSRLPIYQAVVTATNYDTVGFPPLIKGNGSNQWLQTASIDFTGTNKVTVWSGLRKTSDSTGGTLLEFGSAAPAQAFGVYTPAVFASLNNLAVQVRGSGTAYYGGYTPVNAPSTNILTGIFDTTQSTDATKAKMRINGVDTAFNLTSGGPAGTGNFGNLPFYILSRSGTTTFVNGGFNSLIVLGRAASSGEIAMAENWCNQRIRAYG